MPEATQTAPATQEAPLPPTRAALEETDTTLRTLQQLLANLGKNPQYRNSPAFMHVMAKYKELGTELFAARKRIPPPPPIKPKPAAPGYGIAALGRARPGLPAAGPARGPAPLGARPGTPAPAAPQAVPSVSGEGPPGAPGEASEAPAEILPVTEEPKAPPPPTLETPMALPKFAGTLGPPGSKAIDRGPPVANLQQLLLALGHNVDVTGDYDSRTFRAVQEYQLAHRLPVNGMVGLETRKRLNELVSG